MTRTCDPRNSGGQLEQLDDTLSQNEKACGAAQG